MHQRISRAVAVSAAAIMPLLAACGASSEPADGSSAAPTTSAPLSQAPAREAPSMATTSASPSPTVDAAAETKAVEAATEKFVRTVLTVGYPDKSFGQYTDRIEPLMTKEGFQDFESAESVKKGSATLTSLYAQRARSAPRLGKDPKVTSLEAGSATAELDYENVAQRKAGDGWKTVKSLGKGSVTVTLVNDGGTWLVDSAS